MKKLVIFLLIFAIAFLGIGWMLEDEWHRHQQEKLQKEQDEAWLAARQNVPRVKPYPLKTAAYWTSPVMQASDVERLAKHDIVIIDLENKFNNRERLLELKLLNPEIKLLVYSNPMEIFLSTYNNRPWQNQVINEIIHHRPQWLLKTIARRPDGRLEERYAQFWTFPNPMTMLNMSSACPKINGETYSEWMAKKMRRDILSDQIWDGYFQDNGTWEIAWIFTGKQEQVDINGDKRPDRNEVVNRHWEKGVSQYLRLIREGDSRAGFFSRLFKRPHREMIIIANKGDLHFLNRVDGKFFEKFPNDYLGEKWLGGWRRCLNNAGQTGPYTIFQANRANIDFVLASTLLLDNVYLAISQDDSGIFPELEVSLGQPLGSFKYDQRVYTRKYERGIVTVWPATQQGQVTQP